MKKLIALVFSFLVLSCSTLQAPSTDNVQSVDFDRMEWTGWYKDKDSINKMTQYKNINNLVGYLVDGAKGGSGEVFQWNWLKELSDDIRGKLFLAGGINEENLEKAMQEVKPEVVDLSSYLEVNGVKSSQKIKRFMNKVKELGGEIIFIDCPQDLTPTKFQIEIKKAKRKFFSLFVFLLIYLFSFFKSSKF